MKVIATNLLHLIVREENDKSRAFVDYQYNAQFRKIKAQQKLYMMRFKKLKKFV